MEVNKQKEILAIQGMTCANCALGIKKHLDKKGIQQVQVNFATSEATFNKDRNYNTKDVISLINKLGYKANMITDEGESPGLSSIEKKFFFTLIFTLPLFSHMFLPKENFLQNAFVQFFLCLPVFFVGVWHFGKSAYSSLKTGLPNMDVLILMGSSAAFFYSIYGWVLFYGTEQSHHYLFFETTATIITLVLLGNVLEHRSVKQTTTAIRELSEIKTGLAKREVNGEIEETAFDEIKVNDILIVNMGDKIPVDGKVVWGTALIDESMLTGESIPVTKEMEETVIGGTIVKSGSIKMQATSVGDDTLLSQIIELVKNAEDNKPDIQSLGDKVSGIFVPIVLLIAILTFFISHYVFGVLLTDAFLRSIAVLVISCPCAMGLATPTAVMVGIGRAAKKGILLKGGGTLEKLASVKSIVFDKTGTLTTGEFSIKQIKVVEGEEMFVKSIIYNLEKHSSHPIAQSLVNGLQEETKSLEFEKIKTQAAERYESTQTKLGNIWDDLTSPVKFLKRKAKEAAILTVAHFLRMKREKQVENQRIEGMEKSLDGVGGFMEQGETESPESTALAVVDDIESELPEETRNYYDGMLGFMSRLTDSTEESTSEQIAQNKRDSRISASEEAAAGALGDPTDTPLLGGPDVKKKKKKPGI